MAAQKVLNTFHKENDLRNTLLFSYKVDEPLYKVGLLLLKNFARK